MSVTEKTYHLKMYLLSFTAFLPGMGKKQKQNYHQIT